MVRAEGTHANLVKRHVPINGKENKGILAVANSIVEAAFSRSPELAVA